MKMKFINKIQENPNNLCHVKIHIYNLNLFIRNKSISILQLHMYQAKIKDQIWNLCLQIARLFFIEIIKIK